MTHFRPLAKRFREKRRQKDPTYRPPQLVPPPISQLYLNTARYFDPLHDEHGEEHEGWRCDDIGSGDGTIDDFGYEVPARILDTRDPAMVAYQESLRAEPETESESGRTSLEPPRNGMGAHETITKLPTRYTYDCQCEDFRFKEAAASAHRAQV